MTNPMHTARPQLYIINSQPFCAQQTISHKKAPENISTRSETSLRTSMHATIKQTVTMVSSFFSRYACSLASFSISNLQTKLKLTRSTTCFKTSANMRYMLVSSQNISYNATNVSFKSQNGGFCHLSRNIWLYFSLYDKSEGISQTS